MKEFTFHTSTKIVFTTDVYPCIESQLRDAGVEKPFLVTDKNMLNHPQVKKIVENIKHAGFEVTVFSGVEPDPSTLVVEAGIKEYKNGNCDSILALGGGSSIDTARAVGIVISNGGRIEDYEGRNKFSKKLPFFIAVPTTAGTGSENSTGSVITDNQRKIKMTIFGEVGGPDVALLAPELVVNAPPYVLATSGMDALTHAVEAVLGKRGFIYSELLALKAIELVSQNIKKFIKDTGNVEIASQMIIASDLAGMACANAGLGLVHSMAHAMGAHVKRPHGEVCAVLLPHVMRLNLSSETEDKFAVIAEAMGVNADAHAAIEAVENLNESLGIRKDYQDLAVTGEVKRNIARDSMASGITANNPVSVTEENVSEIIHSIF